MRKYNFNGCWITVRPFADLRPTELSIHSLVQGTPVFDHPEDLKNTHMLVRGSFEVDETKGDLDDSGLYHINITADDYYWLYVNGVFIGQGPAPGYPFQYFVDAYDISRFLKFGRNTVAVHVFYQGLHNKVWNSADLRMGLRADIFKGQHLVAKTDESWSYALSRAFSYVGDTGYHTQFIEDFDSSLWDEDWACPDYDDSHFIPVISAGYNDYTFYLSPAKPLSVYEIEPVSIRQTVPGRYVVDFGQEIVGNVCLRAQGRKSDVIIIRNGEELDGSGDRPRFDMRCNTVYESRWTLSGGIDAYHACEYKAFRYAEIEGAVLSDGRNEAHEQNHGQFTRAEVGTDQDDVSKTIKSKTVDKVAGSDQGGAGNLPVLFKSIAARVRHYPVPKERFFFCCDNRLVQEIWDMCANGVRWGTQEGFLDCPTREKGQFLGDATVTAHSFLYLNGDFGMLRKYLRQFAASCRLHPGMLAIAPGSRSQRIADFSLQFPLHAERYYLHTGDIDFLNEMFDVCMQLHAYYQDFQRKDGLLSDLDDQWNLVDWPMNLRDEYDFDLGSLGEDTRWSIEKGPHNVVNGFYYGFLTTVTRIAAFLDRPFKVDVDGFKQAFIAAFYGPETKLFRDSERSAHSALHSNVLPLLFGLCPPEAKDSLVAFIQKKKFSCGVYFAYFVLKALAAVGEYRTVIDFISMREENSWWNMLQEGATTCFEAWGKEKKWNTSLCHAWASAPIPILVEEIIGLRPKKPGWDGYIIQPHCVETLGDFSFQFQSINGAYRVDGEDGRVAVTCGPS